MGEPPDLAGSMGNMLLLWHEHRILGTLRPPARILQPCRTGHHRQTDKTGGQRRTTKGNVSAGHHSRSFACMVGVCGLCHCREVTTLSRHHSRTLSERLQGPQIPAPNRDCCGPVQPPRLQFCFRKSQFCPGR